MEVNFTTLIDALEARVRTATVEDGTPIHITQEDEDPPTAEMCPGVSINLTDTMHQVRYMVGALTAGAPDEITVSHEVRCWEFSASGPKDAARRRDLLVRAVVDAIRGDRTLGGLVDLVEIGGIRFQTVKMGAGIYSVGSITVRCITRG